MDNLYDTLNTSGNLEIWKIYEDNSEELVFNDHNIIVSGMAAGLMSLFGGMYSNNISDFQVRYFQVGTSSYDTVNKEITQLSAPLTQTQYEPSGEGTLILSSVAVRLNKDTTSNQVVVTIPWNQIRRVTPTSVLYTLVLDSNMANNVTLKEVGLFLKSPFVQSQPTPVLGAYKTFPEITKKQEFTLVFKWTLYF